MNFAAGLLHPPLFLLPRTGLSGYAVLLGFVQELILPFKVEIVEVLGDVHEGDGEVHLHNGGRHYVDGEGFIQGGTQAVSRDLYARPRILRHPQFCNGSLLRRSAKIPGFCGRAVVPVRPGIYFRGTGPVSKLGSDESDADPFIVSRLEPHDAADVLRAAPAVEKDASRRVESTGAGRLGRVEDAVAGVLGFLVGGSLLRHVDEFVPQDEAERVQGTALSEVLFESELRSG